MQLPLVQFGAIAAGGLMALGMVREGAPGSAKDDTPEPIELDLPENEGREGALGHLHNMAEFLIISISGCEPKR
ncbi:MAG: hypothetical protein NTX79_04325 [Candidatus Micrarchaeota archaeon]|nr:hypothetical protein [Candidatus Micrarchaeota archaeon]